MPTVSIYFGVSNVSFLFTNSELTEFEFFNFPYVYSQSLLSNYVSDKDFYKNLILEVFKTKKKKQSDYDFVISGFLEFPDLGLPKAEYVSMSQLMSEAESFYPVMVNNYSVITKSSFTSSVPTAPVLRDQDEAEYYANLSIYPNLVTSEIATQIDIDGNIMQLASDSSINLIGGDAVKNNVPLVFTGCRFAQRMCAPELNYLLAMDLINSPGIYGFSLDTRNIALVLLALSAVKSVPLGYDLNSNFEHEGTIIKTYGPCECLVSSDFGTSQLLQLPKNSIQVLPFRDADKLKLNLKSEATQTIEKSVRGGHLGLIFDTREPSQTFKSSMRLLNDTIQAFTKVNQGGF